MGGQPHPGAASHVFKLDVEPLWSLTDVSRKRRPSVVTAAPSVKRVRDAAAWSQT